MDIKDYISEVKSKLSDKRFHHSMCVSKEAVYLANKYGADAKSAEIAGILHDITKEATKEEHLELLNSVGYKLDRIEANSMKLWHQITGSIYCQTKLKIDNQDILNAIRYHTTGRYNMSLLEKVLFIADFTSEDRDYEDVDIIREKSRISLEDAIVYGLTYTIKDLASRNLAISTDSLAIYNQTILGE